MHRCTHYLGLVLQVKLCTRTDSHSWKHCPWRHPGETAAQRRHPSMHRPVMCTNLQLVRVSRDQAAPRATVGRMHAVAGVLQGIAHPDASSVCSTAVQHTGAASDCKVYALIGITDIFYTHSRSWNACIVLSVTANTCSSQQQQHLCHC